MARDVMRVSAWPVGVAKWRLGSQDGRSIGGKTRANSERSKAQKILLQRQRLRQMTCIGWVRPSSMFRAALRVFCEVVSPMRI